ncbi:MAG: hypothetical protein AB4290_27040 [Spirulina sp.]
MASLPPNQKLTAISRQFQPDRGSGSKAAYRMSISVLDKPGSTRDRWIEADFFSCVGSLINI